MFPVHYIRLYFSDSLLYVQHYHIVQFFASVYAHKNIAGYNVQETYENKLNNIEQIIEEKDYRKLLIVCNLKKEITKGVANVQLDANYEEKVIQQIMVSQRLKETLRKVYFEFANNG